ncbi:hypothetical protein C1646_691010 [Rhizophagus diaphanus]|nr:hypothetical protein C1646_691010 [Rhizophagus diaphanus] [Rhizophagus sp. MUCL 43196]
MQQKMVYFGVMSLIFSLKIFLQYLFSVFICLKLYHLVTRLYTPLQNLLYISVLTHITYININVINPPTRVIPTILL